MRTTKTADKAEDEVDDQVDRENGNDELEDEDGEEKTKKRRKPRAVKRGDTVTLRRAGSCRKILLDPAEILDLDRDGVANVKVLGGRSKGHIVENVKRYNLENAIGPTDQVLPSWIADDFEVS